MQNRFKKILLFSAFSMLIIGTSYGDGGWDYYGSGRDHPLSAYVDRRNYVGPADYAQIAPDYIDGPLVLTNANTPAPVMTPIANIPLTQANEFTVTIPNTHGGFNAVVIKRASDGSGFIGPQGEYYPEFPKVFQLQMKYGD